MPFYIDDKLYFEGINLTQEEFYHKLEHDAKISTSMPAPGDVIDLWKSRGGGKKGSKARSGDLLRDVAWCLFNTKEFLFRI